MPSGWNQAPAVQAGTGRTETGNEQGPGGRLRHPARLIRHRHGKAQSSAVEPGQWQHRQFAPETGNELDLTTKFHLFTVSCFVCGVILMANSDGRLHVHVGPGGGKTTQLRRQSAAIAASLSERCKGGGPIALGQPPAIAGQQQRMVMVARHREPEQRLQKALDVGGLEQIPAAHDIGHALQGIVCHGCQHVAYPDVAPGQHNVSQQAGRCRHEPGVAVAPHKRACAADREVGRQPDGMGFPQSSVIRKSAIKAATGTGIDWCNPVRSG